MRTLLFIFVFLLVRAVALQGQSWNFAQKLTASDRNVSDRFSKDLDIDGDYLIVSSHRNSSNSAGSEIKEHAGAVYVFHRNADGSWTETQKLTASDREIRDNFGTAVALSASHMIVGAYKRDEPDSNGRPLYQSGAAYLFERNARGEWVEVQKLIASDRDSLDYFGISVDISDSYALVGAAYKNADDGHGGKVIQAGAAYVFERRANGHWVEVARLRAPDKDDFDLFASSVAIDGKNIMIGAYKEDEEAGGTNTLHDAGAVYVFERTANGKWTFRQKLSAPDRSANDWFGAALAIDGSYAVLAAPQDGEDASGGHPLPLAGSAYVFHKGASGSWTYEAKLSAPDRAEGERFGSSLDIRDEKILIGAYPADQQSGGSLLKDAGKACVFERQSDASWPLQELLLAPDAASGDWFGFAVAMDGDRALVGAFAEDEDTAGNQTLNDAGSAYLFEKEEGLYSPAGLSPEIIVQIGPNPAGDRICIYTEAEGYFELQIASMSGQILRQRVVSGHRCEIDISELSAGVYYLQISSRAANTVRTWIKR